MKIDLSIRNEWVVVVIDGRVDTFTYHLLESDLQTLLRTGIKKIVLDLSKNNYMNLGGYKLLKQIHENLEAIGGKLVMVSPSEEFMKQLNYFIAEDKIEVGQKIEEICV
jgi:anti-anti-sigma factor